MDFLEPRQYFKINDPDYLYPIWVKWDYIKSFSGQFNQKELFVKLKSGMVYRHVY